MFVSLIKTPSKLPGRAYNALNEGAFENKSRQNFETQNVIASDFANGALVIKIILVESFQNRF